MRGVKCSYTHRASFTTNLSKKEMMETTKIFRVRRKKKKNKMKDKKKKKKGEKSGKDGNLSQHIVRAHCSDSLIQCTGTGTHHKNES